ncbi:hypothetical protein BCONGLO52_27560 [Brachybacterium conglomeratum]|uniref:Uncharacterized protein n=1 Tax=Brachybacterium conglomeratum TaxID=47846 RepID=A0ABQ5RLT8_9MICO|nr:hypothetical protein BCONGLO52_27560 [Brachybacterium conglomeratum]GLK03448.1 hypothetical protein GCM10017597_02470 [Brachybacterium conglomeratum]
MRFSKRRTFSTPVEITWPGEMEVTRVIGRNTRRFAATSTTNPTARALLRVCGTTTTSRTVATASPIGSKTEVPTSLAA